MRGVERKSGEQDWPDGDPLPPAPARPYVKESPLCNLKAQ
eukprot:CAMPEP_0115537492 /NCGR_PEP_ID=MMETSP0271-20121206/88364_1 /TAXON_ID=71861 /ORGANISM="Scrippsiella trochoidea, Strain CCMP3099" /LENGTH=39 /DNA_ID= /DNA_START= /DNA_END= /DNA_ORIENTATION=